MRRGTRSILFGYVLLLHGVVWIAFKSSGNGGSRVFESRSRAQVAAFHDEMQSYHARVDANVPDRCVLFLGDSHVQGLAVSAVTPNSVNFGIGHDSTASLLQRLPNYRSLDRARNLVVCVGTNDVLRGERSDRIIENYTTICARLPSELSVIVCSLFPIGAKAEVDAKYNRQARAINQSLRELCADNRNLHFLDVAAAIRGEDGYLQPRYASPDGIHLSPKGYAKWIDAMNTALANVIDQSHE